MPYKYKLKEIEVGDTQVNEEDIDEISTSAGAGSYLSKYASKKPKKQKELPEGIGATLGPGPSASEEGVKDNYYVKKFGYKLVPDKIPGSGIIVRKLFEDDKEDELSQQEIYHKERIADFDIIKKKLDNIYKLNNRARLKTKEYYKEFPESYAIAYSTGLIKDYLKDIEELYKDED